MSPFLHQGPIGCFQTVGVACTVVVVGVVVVVCFAAVFVAVEIAGVTGVTGVTGVAGVADVADVADVAAAHAQRTGSFQGASATAVRGGCVAVVLVHPRVKIGRH